ncbi:phosphatidylglycerophosphatase A family protein [Sulfurospirillum oryzae]|uniref:phosphatidylglycerophosphatase A family protein n=1 Tax=Sulfurospirillum oryzae TaxID=2976535 RepID=UPI0021E77181|nr:phosphatidylglycerophosphatase A [Sulfurospirillum oryzae]
MPNAFLTFLYTGLSPKAPGTAGSLLAVIVGALIIQYVSMETLVLLSILFTIMGIKQINAYEANGGEHDDKRIVIDEVVGVWIALILSSGTLVQIVLSFAFFRLFDIWKPSLIGRIDQNVKGGWGVIGDDMLAGVIAGICSAGTFQLLEYAQKTLLN